MSKKVYVCVNKDNGFTLYNKVMGTWNDGQGRRDGSTVWTFSARKSPEESKTMQAAKEHLARLGFTNVEFVLRTIEEEAPANTEAPAEVAAAQPEQPVEDEQPNACVSDETDEIDALLSDQK